MPELLWPAALSLLLVVGAIGDILKRRLPNWLSLALLVTGLAFAFANGGIEAIGWHGAHAAIALAVGMALFAGGIIGGGDAKFYAGAAAWFPLSDGLSLLLSVSLAGLAAIIIWFGSRRVFKPGAIDPDSLYAKFPYGVAIAGGGLWLLWSALPA
ncbi:peptidase A24 [Altererythrobacter sp. BO-6]|uniref:A24 family peptidase n=1 Tax=Altererythrobacter sp. BO-6 TaxID=2604537 RepID=UPI0013E11723|nr:prepilin peptidase [Altererythrobacter sp. BO-6]QIG55097.1 peptidase A24 [Altererythrobacter sp. BO-6]